MRLDNISVTQEGEGITIRLNSAESTARLNSAESMARLDTPKESPKEYNFILHEKHMTYKIIADDFDFMYDLMKQLEKTIKKKDCHIFKSNIDCFSECLKNCTTLDEINALLTIVVPKDLYTIIDILSICGYKVRDDKELYKKNIDFRTTYYHFKVYKSQTPIQYKIYFENDAFLMGLKHKHNKNFESICLIPNTLSPKYLVYY